MASQMWTGSLFGWEKARADRRCVNVGTGWRSESIVFAAWQFSLGEDHSLDDILVRNPRDLNRKCRIGDML